MSAVGSEKYLAHTSNTYICHLPIVTSFLHHELFVWVLYEEDLTLST